MGHSHTDGRQHGGLVIDIAQLVALVEEVRTRTAAALDELVGKLGAASAADVDYDFGALVKAAQQLLELDDGEMARMLKVSRPTIGRWIRGFSTPHQLGRRAIFDALTQRARAKAKSYRD